MKQRVEYITEGEEEVVFRVYRQEGISDLELLKQKEKVIGNLEGEKVLFQPQQILYLEYVDAKVFAYTKDQVIQMNLSLEKLEERLKNFGFLRVSKAVIANIDEITSFQCMVGNRMIATMSNGEKLVISRHYSKQIRYYLKEVNGSGKAEKDSEA